ncbi:MAG: response regulator [Armatimonadetes bacterium]|nr:response regulator [Anaerolineae bacterium]
MPPKILYIQDEPLNTRSLHNMLKFSGYDVTIAQTGNDGIEMAQIVQPDVILLDLDLPNIDSFEVAKRLRDQSIFNHVPIMVLSAHASPQARRDAFAAGCNSYITKPTGSIELMRRLQQYLTHMTSAQGDQFHNKPQ